VNERVIKVRSLWPDTLLQLNPAYEKTKTVADLAAEGRLHPTTADVFRDREGNSFHLYRHQTEVIDLATNKQPYVVTSGTGSGKTLTYSIPIFDAILRGDTAANKVWAIIVYPMNALVNSQEQALQTLADRYEEAFGQPMPTNRFITAAFVGGMCTSRCASRDVAVSYGAIIAARGRSQRRRRILWQGCRKWIVRLSSRSMCTAGCRL